MFPNMEVIVQRGTHLVCSMFPYMEVIVQRGYTSCLFNVSLYGSYGSYCTKGVHILFVQCFLIWKLLYKGGTHLVCSMFPYMEVIVQRGYTSCLFNVSLYGSYCTKGVHILFVQCFLIWKLLYKGVHILFVQCFLNMEVIVQRGYTSCLFNVSLIWKLLYKGYTSCLFNVS